MNRLTIPDWKFLELFICDTPGYHLAHKCLRNKLMNIISLKPNKIQDHDGL